MTRTETVEATTTSALRRDPHAERAIELGFAVTRLALEDASILDDVPNGCALFLLPEGETEFLERSIELGSAAIRRGENVYFKHIPADFGKDETNEG